MLVDIQYLDEDALGRGQIVELQKRVDLLTSRSFYRDAAEICSRLKHLHENFGQFVRRKVQSIPGFSD